MPLSPKRICNRCRRAYRGKCDCRPFRQERRDQATVSFNNRTYGRRWKEFRLRYLAANPLCLDCQAAGRVAAATEVHHKQRVKDAPHLQFDDDNLLPLCKSHHSARTRRGE